jgi:hypothetical protein
VPERYHRLAHEGGVRWSKLLAIAAATGTLTTITNLLEGKYDAR